MTNSRIISIEGNIGSGKTTLLTKLKELYANNNNVFFLKEPVEEWETILDSDGNTMLQKFYADQERYSFSFQMVAYISRLAIIRNALKLNPGAIFITERSLFTDKYVFAKMLYDKNKIESVNYQIYLKWFNEFANEFPIESIIYVKAEPSICHQRIHKRARLGENVIPIEYLNLCDQYHNNYINIMKNNSNITDLDGNIDIFENPNIINEWLNIINNIIN